MDRNDRDRNDRGNTGSEDASQAREAVHRVEENRDALEQQARRVDATAPDSTDQPIRGIGNDAGSGSGGMRAGSGGTGTGSDDPSQAAANVRSVEEDTEAIREQARRVEASAPDDVNRTGPPQQQR